MVYLLVLVAVASRLLPHPPNVAFVSAVGLFAGCYLSSRRAYLIPLAAMLISDAVGHLYGLPGLGFYNATVMLGVYAGMMLAVPIGAWVGRQRGWLRIPAGSIAASTCFFLLSNFAVWAAGWYPLSVGGLLSCFTHAIPFYGYTLAGDLVFAGLLFGCWEFSRQLGPRSATIERLAPHQAI